MAAFDSLAMGGPFGLRRHTAALRVLAQVMQANVVHREVREKGGAYGE